MYKSNRYLYVINTLLVIAIIINIIFITNMDVDFHSVKTNSKHLMTYLSSEHIEKEELKTLEENKVTKETKKQENKPQLKQESKTETKTNLKSEKNEIAETKKEEKVTSKETAEKKEVVEKKETVKTEKVLEKLTGALAGYGPDCYGCTSFRTASGRYIGDGKIYYEDKDYGTIRIVAGDKKYPFGTIVKISNTKYDDNSPIYAIVLDRGGGVGVGKKFLFDLLFKTEKEASKYGSRKNVTFEILRLGY